MIDIEHLKISYQNQHVINDISLSFPNIGFIVLLGDSGSGKTTIFNAISGLIPYEGNIKIDGVNIKNIKESKLNNFRLKNIGFVFQDFKLFNLDTVYHNVSFPFEVINGYSSLRNSKRIHDLIELVGLKDKEERVVKNLSGGEKQRVAIARSIVNDPKVVLADEPTGALDENNGHEIMSLLKNISKDRLVIVISHDEELVQSYADQIIRIKDGKILNIYRKNKEICKKNIKLIKSEYKKNKPSIPPSFLFRHTKNSIKERKWRSLLIMMITSLGLIGVGLASSLSNAISGNIKKAYSSLIDEKQIMITNENKDNITIVESVEEEDVTELVEEYSDVINDIGYIYHTDFNNVFKDDNSFSVFSNGTKINIPSYNAKHINEFTWLEKCEQEIFPELVKNLKDDEIILSLPLGTISSICYQLHILRNVVSLADYILNNDLYFVLNVETKEWGYSDAQIFKIKGFTLDYEPRIYHSNHKWNKIVFENNMRLPTNLNLSVANYYPWTLKKILYFDINIDNRDSFLNKIRYIERYDDFIFEIASHNYFPSTIYNEDEVKYIDKLLVFKNNIKYMNVRMVDRIMDNNKNISSPILGTYGGYAIYPEAMMMGFSSFTYFSFDKKLLENTLNEYASMATKVNEDISMPHNIEVGHFSKSFQNGVNFRQIPYKYQELYKPSSLDEIVISKGLLESFDTLNKDILTVSVTTNEQTLHSGKVLRDYRYIDLKVIGVIDDEQKYIYHNRDWLIDFYQCRVGVSIYNLGINVVSVSLNDGADMDTTISELSRAFPKYIFTNPLNNIDSGIDEVCSYIEIAMIIFSSIAILIAVFMLTICNYLHILEIRRDIGLSRCIGVSKLEATKFIFYHSYFMSGLSFVIASLELILTNVVIARLIANNLKVSFSFSLNPMSLVYMFLLSFLIATISSILISFKVSKLSPIESLKVM